MMRLLKIVIAIFTISTTSALADYPEREVLGVVMWGAGGATDTVARAINPAAEAELGKPIVVLNKSGGAGAISTAYVNAAPADGYTFLYGAENPQLHGVMDVADLDYGDMYPITTGGKLFTFFILIIGLGIVAIPTGLFASALSKAREEG